MNENLKSVEATANSAFFRKDSNIQRSTVRTQTTAGGGARTHTILRSLDFESSASANSATPAKRIVKLRRQRRSSSASNEIAFVADAHRDDGKRFVARADEKLTAFVELESALRCLEAVGGIAGLVRFSGVFGGFRCSNLLRECKRLLESYPKQCLDLGEILIR
jgi:hypothetical protein